MKWKILSAALATLSVLAGVATRGDSPAASRKIEPAGIDAMIRAQWRADQVVPAPAVDDARYLRRVYLDITGDIPSEEAVTAFLADRSPDKRQRAVDALLDSPRYADNWTTYWDGVLMGHTLRAPQLDRVAWKQWLHDQFARNVGYNRFVYNLITATGVNSAGGTYAMAAGLMTPADRQRMAATGQDGSQPIADDGSVAPNGARVNGAVNWILKFQQSYADLAGQASKLFLGVQIQCAQCHDHKTEKWKQDDFRRFAACFVAARPRPLARQEKGMIRQVDLEDSDRQMRFIQRRTANGPMPGINAKVAEKQSENRPYVEAQPTAIDGTDFGGAANRRQALAAWMTAPENPWFAEAIVNRVWAHFLGRGFVEPIDDFRPSNPPVMPELLKQLSDDFVVHEYDLKHLVRTICATQVYQLASAPAGHADPTNKYWARYRLKPMGPEELMDSIVQATNIGPLLERVYGANLENIKFGIMRQFTFLSDVDEEFEQKDFEGTIPQALMLLNGGITNKAVLPMPGTALSGVLQLPGGDAQRIKALYLRTLSRSPSTDEVARWTQFVNAPRQVVDSGGDQPGPQMRMRRMLRKAAGQGGKRQTGPAPDLLGRVNGGMLTDAANPKTQAYEDLFWTLLNSSEFMFNH